MKTYEYILCCLSVFILLPLVLAGKAISSGFNRLYKVTFLPLFNTLVDLNKEEWLYEVN